MDKWYEAATSMRPRPLAGAGVLLIAVLCGGSPAVASGQTWEADLRWVRIDHDPEPNVSSAGEQIPPGIGVSVRHVWSSGLFVGLELSRGAEDRAGAICGGLIAGPTDCVSETVGYSGGLVAVSAGRRLRRAIAPEWWLALRPALGLGSAWVREVGRDTGRAYAQTPFTFLAGLVAETGHHIPWESLTIIGSVGVAHLRPAGLGGCEDCRLVLRKPMPQLTMGLGVAW